MRPIPVTRRLALAIIGIVIAATVLRPQLSDALVLRGDGCLYRGQSAAALRYYRRAMAIDAADGVAVDRFAFVAMTSHDSGALADAIAFATAYLSRHEVDEVVRMDRAMAYRATGDADRAMSDFADVGARTRDVRALTFAGYAARAAGRRERARAFWRSAIALAPGFPPALHGLQRLERVR